MHRHPCPGGNEQPEAHRSKGAEIFRTSGYTPLGQELIGIHHRRYRTLPCVQCRLGNGQRRMTLSLGHVYQRLAAVCTEAIDLQKMRSVV